MRITFDVDGVICDDRDPSLPYAQRPPYPGVAERLKKLADSGLVIILATARYMRTHGGDQDAAHAAGFRELVSWLARHGIPYHELYLGKPSSHLYCDDRGFSLRSNNGEADWDRLETLLANWGRHNDRERGLCMTKEGAD